MLFVVDAADAGATPRPPPRSAAAARRASAARRCWSGNKADAAGALGADKLRDALRLAARRAATCSRLGADGRGRVARSTGSRGGHAGN